MTFDNFNIAKSPGGTGAFILILMYAGDRKGRPYE
jgi:hypothetical protein